ncbi:far upstream element-binding protein 2-like isoform X2 [Asparagus officinalis]|uniref:far upstream element-binding protein 2-like isoform X2 n=1 Tax=Asparagus officinalis TaxID=4686 RepID=UPI00098E67B2|nr:far upstream element-binding protein 2-like isoform X2 [Asparagus officinalis]
MAEETATPTTTAVETSPVAESAIPPPEEPTLNKPTEAPHEEEEVKGPKDVVSAEPSETSDAVPLASDHKRKLEDIKGEDEKEEEEEDGDVKASEKKDGNETKVVEPEDAGDSKRQRVEGGGVDGLGVEGSQVVQKEEDPSLANGQLPYTENVEPGSVETVQKSAEDVAQPGTLPSAEQDSSRKIEIPNSKVGALIGKAGETIRLLQSNSGARIQITRDAEADPSSSSRPVELIGTLENINKAEQMIKDVIAEAVAGGSPALVARGFGAAQSSSEVHEMQVPNEKVGVIIGKGGETIKTLQTKSQARIQIIPQHLPEGDLSKERTVRITGNKKQIESAKIMIMEVMNQMPGRPSSFSAGHTQSYHPRGPSTQPQWGPRGPHPGQSQMQQGTAYDYPQRGWEQRPAVPAQTPGGYDYYAQGQGNGMGTQQHNSAPVNYYGQSQASGYSQHPNPYPQSGPPQQSYGGHGYNDPNYYNQAPTQQMYGQQQQPVSSQPGFYPQQANPTPQATYAQQPPYSKPAAYTGAPQSYGPPSGGPTQQPYPSAQNYGPTSGYSQPSSQVAPNYVQGGQPPPAYSQPSAQSGGYGQYPATQPAAYGEQPASNANYGYQAGPTDAAYANNAPPAANPVTYDQSMAPQASYASAPVSYAKGVSPQPGGYGWQA